MKPLCLSLMTAMAASALANLPPSLEAPVLSDPALQPYYFSIPAPRGQILDTQGQPLARNVVVHRLTLRVPPLAEETPEAYAAWVDEYWPTVQEAFPGAIRPDADLLKQQFEHRRRLPLVISATLSAEDAEALQNRPEFVDVQPEYAREYPHGTTAAHIIGYVTTAGAPLRGPLLYGEPLWREVAGREGLEASMNEQLSGVPGLMMIAYDKEGRVAARHVIRPPVPGKDVVTTLQLQLQQQVEKSLKAAKRPGAMCVMDVSTGSILAMASEPTFDPNVFSRGVDKGTFDKLAKDTSQPMFNRAVSALYPPGSVFKPFVGLAAMRSGVVQAHDLIPCGPYLVIDNRTFQNWTDKDSGYFDLKGALVRSFNTYFYQAAINTGDKPILATAREFGFGEPIDIPLGGVARGELPERVPSRQGLANLSIGQSPLLSSPLEVTIAMATLADGLQRPKARLVKQVQDQEGNVISATLPAHAAKIRYGTDAMVTIHSAMYGVVNHTNGTGVKARVPNMRVYGKTGTAQWSRKGEMVNAVWFAGFIKDSDPPLAYAVALEGKKGERVFGGAAAAPVAGAVLTAIAAKPANYALVTRKVKAPQENYTLAHYSQFGMPMDVAVSDQEQTPAGRQVIMPMSRQAMASYFGDYPAHAPTPPPAGYPSPVTVARAQQMAPPPPTERAVPDEVPRAVPVREVRMPEYFQHYAAPEVNNYYERARPIPRTSSNGRRGFLFPSRR
jgi:penicillin-binding protein 2